MQLIEGRFAYDFREYFVFEIQLFEVDICRRAHVGKISWRYYVIACWAVVLCCTVLCTSIRCIVPIVDNLF